MKEMSPLEEIRHSSAHILATAVLRLFPEAKLDIGPPTDSGFYYDFDIPHKFTADDLEAIEAEMKNVIKENQRFERFEKPREEAIELINEIGQAEYKLGRLNDIPEGEAISFYRNGEFVDLCAGTHVNYSKKIKAVKLLSIAGAYHRGDEKNKQLQRIYGTAFASKEELQEYLDQQEEAKKRDHRKIGKDMQLFHIDEAVGQGLVLWTPKGSIIRNELQNFISEELRKQGYDQVYTPHIGKLELFKTSGHFPYYQDSQYPPVIDRQSLADLADANKSCSDLTNLLEDGQIEGYLLKPMNCPMHIKLFDSQHHSYRDLPQRFAEFGTVYRWEQSGELNGMTRVRGFTQDDAHIFCTDEQVKDEIQGCLDLVKTVFNVLGMEDYRVRVSLRDPDSTKYVGSPENWEKAETALREVAATLGVPFSEEPGEAAFYGPKIDFVVRDVIGREWQLGTVQVDYNLPERFNLSYIGADNKPHRPVMVHRAPFGSMERFCGVLIEHFAGNFPTWLAPEQVRLLPINDAVLPFTQEVEAQLKAKKVRVKIDAMSEKLGAKIRRAEMDKVPFVGVIGGKEAEEKTVTARSRVAKSKEGPYPVAEYIDLILNQIKNKTLPET
ncbi:MAG: threonine--tRNA ligase [Verrucomicrobia bacterium]|nr:threonine--tRNA ligase [Verrucomicrobiota bacterium]MDA1068747.1 threonine--tRNA ligase [Verrucomicrobiota bacterium]